MIDPYWEVLIQIANEDGNTVRAFEFAQEYRRATFEKEYAPSVRKVFSMMLRRKARQLKLELNLRNGRPGVTL